MLVEFLVHLFTLDIVWIVNLVLTNLHFLFVFFAISYFFFDGKNHILAMLLLIPTISAQGLVNEFPVSRTYTGNLTLGQGTMIEIICHRHTDKSITLGLLSYGCYRFNYCQNWEYIADKMRMTQWEGDARNIADFIAAQFGSDREEQGRYYSCLQERV